MNTNFFNWYFGPTTGPIRANWYIGRTNSWWGAEQLVRQPDHPTTGVRTVPVAQLSDHRAEWPGVYVQCRVARSVRTAERVPSVPSAQPSRAEREALTFADCPRSQPSRAEPSRARSVSSRSQTSTRNTRTAERVSDRTAERTAERPHSRARKRSRKHANVNSKVNSRVRGFRGVAWHVGVLALTFAGSSARNTVTAEPSAQPSA